MSKPPAFPRVRGRSFIAFVLAPEPPLAGWLGGLDAQIAQSPAFFDGRPVVLDLAALAAGQPGVETLMQDLARRGLRVVACENLVTEFASLGFPPALAGGRGAGSVEPHPPAEPRQEANAKPPAVELPSMLIDQPVRSGRSVVFPQGDVTVIGAVSSGAEVVAGGSVHVYGALRGRAVAGLMGNRLARIFCQRLEAELIAIDGHYKTAEMIEPALLGRPVQAWLEGDRVRLAALD